MVKPGTRYALAAGLLLLLVVAAVGVSLYLSSRAVGNADRQWCSALDLLTRHPVPAPANPGANPSRAEAYELYSDFIAIKRHFGC